MRGKILSFDSNTGTGAISGDDQNRYSFTVKDAPAGATLRVGKSVDFVPEDGRATQIIPVAGTLDTKNKWIAAALAFFVGYLGVHKFYLGRMGAGITMLLVFLGGLILLGIPSLVIAVIAFIECIIYLITGDDDFHEKYVERQKAWF